MSAIISQNGAISDFLEVTETIKILQPLINFFDIIYEKIWYFSESKTIDVHTCPIHLHKHVFFGRMRGK